MRGHLSVTLMMVLIILLVGVPAAIGAGIMPFDRIYTLDQGGVDPPIVEWYGIPMNATTGWTMMWDGIYTGQTEEVWEFQNWVNDSDGVDEVIYQFKGWNDDGWINRTSTLIEGDSTYGRYEGNYTYRVWWDWETNRVKSEGGFFWFRIFANDSLGNWIATPPVAYSGGYMLVHPPPQFYIIIFAPFIITASCIALSIITVYVVLRKKPTQSS